MTNAEIVAEIDKALALNKGSADVLLALKAQLVAVVPVPPPVVVPPPVEPPPVVVPPPIIPPATGSRWRGIAPYTATLEGCPSGPYKNIWIVGAKGTKQETWWIWPKSGNAPTSTPTHAGTTLTVVCEPKITKTVAAVEVTVLWPDGTTRVWNLVWNGEGGVWPTYGIGTTRCPVVSIMQHEGQKPVTSPVAHLIKGVLPGLDFEAVTLDIGYLKEQASETLEVRYRVGGLAVTDWLKARACKTDLALASLPLGIKNGTFDIDFELRGPDAFRFAPLHGQLILHRPGALESPAVVVADDASVTMDPVNVQSKAGYAYVEPSKLAGMGPITAKYAPWTGPPPADMRVTALTPCSKLFESLPMLWDSRINGKPYMRSFPPKHDEAPKSLNPDFPNSNAQPPHATLPTSDLPGPTRWLSNYAVYSGIRGGGWVSSDPGGAVALHDRVGGFKVIAGWTLKAGRFPIWPFAGKAVAKIRENMEFRSTGDMKPEMVCTLTDISVDPVTKTRAVCPDYKNHVVWEIDWSRGVNDVRTRIVAGQFGKAGYADGSPGLLNAPVSAAYSPTGMQVVIADQNNDAIRSWLNGSLSTLCRDTASRAKYGITTPSWTIREQNDLSLSIMIAPQWVRWGPNGVVFSDLGTSTIRRTGVSGFHVLLTDNLNLSKSGWSAFDLDAAGDIYFVNFTGSNFDDRTGTRRGGPLNEMIQYVKADGLDKRVAVFGYAWNGGSRPITVGNGLASHTISPHYPWGCWVHPDGALAVNGAGTHGTVILTPKDSTEPIPTWAHYDYDWYMNGDPPRANPPQFSLGPMASWIASGSTDAQIAAAYPDWYALTDGERTTMLGTVRHFHRR